ncbi:undecaprenyl diphosphate synthase family protein [Chloroflexi bacterium TSY]|nr:undecaprenyl diphosphate synthase family protein [Chloroflexi bacterium TSY]
MDKAVAQTEQNGPHIFNMVFNYGGRAEIVHAARQLMVENSGAGTIAEAELESCLWTAGLPDVNLVLRTGGDKRISNFLLWKASDASVYVADNYWPAVTQQDIEEGIAAYNGRFGSVSQSV